MWILLPWILQGFDIVHNEIVGFVQFGWEWQDQMFTIESEEKCEGFCILTLDSEHRELPIKLQ